MAARILMLMMTTQTISSQRYLDDAIVQAKRDAEDYAVQVVFVVVDGERYRVVVDGHHSLAAAKADGVKPEYELAARELVAEAKRDGIAFLEAHHGGDDYYDVETGLNVWQ